MNPNITCLIVGLFATSVAAQEVRVKIAPSASDVLKYTVNSKSEMKTDTKRTIDGEERPARGAGGATKSEQTLVFQEGPDGSNWRKYITAAASVTKPTRQGEDQKSKIVGAIAGKTIFMVKDGKKTVFKAGSATGEALPRATVQGIPAKLTLAGLLPAKAVEVQGKYELKKSFAQALRKLLQPVRAARPADAQGGNRGQGRRRGRGRGNPSTWNAVAVRLLGSKKLTTKGTGQLVSVTEKDGTTLAVLEIDAVLSGAGTPTELGMGRQTRRRGGGGNNEDTGKASISIKVTGQIVVNQTQQRIQSVSLKGKLQSNSESSRTTERNGEERKIDTVQSTQGTFAVDVAVDNIGPAPKEIKKEATATIK
jgi:hypothetical protein